ncbi:hypothetical protein PENSPDRAFT_671478 [Peniophora sp. CONT]|nr:hypothetical protein PENSPDRAFT_671478 [Peniophora sp. CONT]
MSDYITPWDAFTSYIEVLQDSEQSDTVQMPISMSIMEEDSRVLFRDHNTPWYLVAVGEEVGLTKNPGLATNLAEKVPNGYRLVFRGFPRAYTVWRYWMAELIYYRVNEHLVRPGRTFVFEAKNRLTVRVGKALPFIEDNTVVLAGFAAHPAPVVIEEDGGHDEGNGLNGDNGDDGSSMDEENDELADDDDTS